MNLMAALYLVLLGGAAVMLFGALWVWVLWPMLRKILDPNGDIFGHR